MCIQVCFGSAEWEYHWCEQQPLILCHFPLCKKENVPNLLLYYPIVLCIPEGASLNSLPAPHSTRDQWQIPQHEKVIISRSISVSQRRTKYSASLFFLPPFKFCGKLQNNKLIFSSGCHSVLHIKDHGGFNCLSWCRMVCIYAQRCHFDWVAKFKVVVLKVHPSRHPDSFGPTPLYQSQLDLFTDWLHLLSNCWNPSSQTSLQDLNGKTFILQGTITAAKMSHWNGNCGALNTWPLWLQISSNPISQSHFAELQSWGNWYC